MWTTRLNYECVSPLYRLLIVACYLQFFAIDIEHKPWQNYVWQKVCLIYVSFLYYEHEFQN